MVGDVEREKGGGRGGWGEAIKKPTFYYKLKKEPASKERSAKRLRGVTSGGGVTHRSSGHWVGKTALDSKT